jgi:hypothetical protein
MALTPDGLDGECIEMNSLEAQRVQNLHTAAGLFPFRFRFCEIARTAAKAHDLASVERCRQKSEFIACETAISRQRRR